jgi:Tfp pilus assembly protein FimT
MPTIDVVTPGVIEDTADRGDGMPEAEGVNAGVAYTAMANAMANASGLATQGFAASADRRTVMADQLAGDSQRMWSIAMTSPTVMAAHGMRVASEAGSGRTRVEANTPAGSQTIGGGT